MEGQDICFFFKHIWERAEKHANNTLSAFDLTFTQSYALDFIVEREGMATQRELEEYMEIQHSAVVGIVSRLESKGLVVTAFSTRDRRQKLLIPTERGRTVYEDISEDKARVQTDLVNGFSEDELCQLNAMLTRVYHNLDNV